MSTVIVAVDVHPYAGDVEDVEAEQILVGVHGGTVVFTLDSGTELHADRAELLAALNPPAAAHVNAA